MSQEVVDRLRAQFGERVLETSDAFGDHEVVVALKDWVEVAQFMKDDGDLQMDHFIDLTAVDYPERDPARFDLVLMTRSSVTAKTWSSPSTCTATGDWYITKSSSADHRSSPVAGLSLTNLIPPSKNMLRPARQ